MSDSILWLTDLAARDRARAGGKGAGLAQLTQWGLPVPPGFVVAAPALSALLEAAGLLDAARSAHTAGWLDDSAALERTAEQLRARALELALPNDLRDAIVAAYGRLEPSDPAPPVAVRSSAAAEDAQHASFAGQQETFLDVRGAEAVVAHVQRCLASLFTPRALFYRTRQHAWDDLGIAVVVQRMVAARKAGILFTRDPVQRRAHVVVVEAVPGSGEALASGEAVPDHYEVDRGSRAVLAAYVPPRALAVAGVAHAARDAAEVPPPRVLDDAELGEVVALGLQTEALFAGPQDVEWAIGDRLYLLQSRPITT